MTSENKKSNKNGNKITMIECKEFIFNPTGNGVVNFAYRLVVDEATAKESEDFMKGMKEKYEADLAKHESGKHERDKTECESESCKAKRECESVVPIDNFHEPEVIMPAPVVKAIMPPEITKTRRSGRRESTVLPTIEEETEKELKRLEDERRFYEEFCEGYLPPPEDKDDWSSAIPVKNLKKGPEQRFFLTKEQMAELGIVQRVDKEGNVVVDVPKEVQERVRAMPEYRCFVKMLAEKKKRSKGVESDIKEVQVPEKTESLVTDTTATVDEKEYIRKPISEVVIVPDTEIIVTIDDDEIQLGGNLTRRRSNNRDPESQKTTSKRIRRN